MTKAARLTQAQVERAIKAAKRQGATAVDLIEAGTTIRIHLDDPTGEPTTIAPEPLPFDKWKAGQHARKA